MGIEEKRSINGMQKDTKQDDRIAAVCCEQIEQNKAILDLVNSWIVAADTKVSIICGVFSAVFAVIVYFADSVLSDRTLIEGQQYACWNKISMILACAALVAFLLSLLFMVLTVSPKLYKADKNRKGKYSIFYEEIADFKDAKSFVDCANKSTKIEYNEEILNEIYLNSKICSRKMKQFGISLWLSFASIVVEVGSCIIYYLITV